MVKSQRKPGVVLYVEGGSKGALATECRRGFSLFFERAGLSGRMPHVVPCGSRQKAFDAFCVGIAAPQKDTSYMLLVDSESEVTERSPWSHVRNRPGDGWAMPTGATDSQLHLMVQLMESWFLADVPALKKVFRKNFMETALPTEPARGGTLQIERLPKATVSESLAKATRARKSGKYAKGSHSFRILAAIDPALVQKASPWAKRLVDSLRLF